MKSKTWFKLSFTSGLALFALAFVGMTVVAPKTYASCDNVNIIHCGLSGSGASGYTSSMQNYWNTSKDDLGHTDIKAVMQWGGWTQGKVTDGAARFAVGSLNSKTGKITVGGTVVATNTVMTARFSGGAGFTQILPGVWKRAITTSHAQDAYTILLHLDANGKADAGIAVDCGNVITFNPVAPPAAEPVPQVAKCTGLKATLSSKKNTYNFVASTKLQNAKLTGGSFNFGDGTKGDGTVKGSTLTANHTFSKSGEFTIVATLKFNSLGAPMSDTCQTKIVISSYACGQLSGTFIDKEKLSYRYVATIKADKAQFIDATFDFGDGKTVSGVKSTDGGKTVSADHQYAQPGTYHAFASLRFTVDGQTVTAPACLAFVTPTTPPTPECKPGVPVGDVRCNPCEYDSSITADDENCVETGTTLPNTGAGNVVAVSAAALVAGFLWYRHILFRKHKAAYAAADLGTSPLPLGDPLDADAPLAGTPVEPSRRRMSLRRNRRF